MKNVDIIIIGAGLTGLSLAYLLQNKGKKVLLLEKTDRVGGVIQSHQQGGYVFDTGPNTAVLASAEIVKLFTMLQTDPLVCHPCEIEIAHKEAQKRLIWKNGRLHALPSGMYSGLMTPLFSWRDKLGILFEPFRKKGTFPNESIANLTKRRLGNSIFNYAVDPFISGIYAGNPDTLITRFALPKLYALEQTYGSFIGGAIKKSKIPKTADERLVTKEVFSVKGGMEQLAKALLSGLDPEMVYYQTTSTVRKRDDIWEVQIERDKINTIITAPIVVSTINALELPQVFPFAEPKLMQAITQLRYAPVIQVSVGIADIRGVDLKAFGALIPSIEKRNVLGILYPSSCFDGRSPKGRNVLSVFIGGMQHQDLYLKSDDEIKDLITEELKTIYKQDQLLIDYIHIARYPQAIAQYEANTGERLEAINGFETKYPGIVLAGGMLGGIGMADRVKQAFQIAGKLTN